jgi:hypothetical protein
MSMKAYVVASGEYEYYHIDGIFSSRENAEEFIATENPDGWHSGEFHIEEYELDQWTTARRAGLKPYDVLLDKDTAKLYHAKHNYMSMGPPRLLFQGFYNDGLRFLGIWAKDDEHAVQIALARRLEALANGEIKVGR